MRLAGPPGAGLAPRSEACDEPMADPLAVEMRGIVKRFPGVLANDHVDFELRAGEIHAPAGRERRRQEHADEHPGRAVPAGRRAPSSVDGQPVDLPLAARRDRGRASGMIHQHFTLVRRMTVTENMLLGLARPRFRLRLRRLRRGRSPSSGERTACGSTRGPRSGSCRWASSSGSRSSRCCTAAPTC